MLNKFMPEVKNQNQEKFFDQVMKVSFRDVINNIGFRTVPRLGSSPTDVLPTGQLPNWTFPQLDSSQTLSWIKHFIKQMR